MIQKMKEYTIKRTSEVSYNEIGERIPAKEETFTMRLAISTANGNTAYSNLIRSVQSTHNAVFFDGMLKTGDIIVAEDGTSYLVDYAYIRNRKGIGFLTEDSGYGKA